MTLTLLLDLDDTLLRNDIHTFMPPYLQALGKHLARHVDPGKMVRVLLAATQAMVDNERPDLTLERVFDSHFYIPLGLAKDALRAPLEDFYANTFPNLRTYTQSREDAVAFIKKAKQKGYRLAVATNPLFPLMANEHRLAWAGFSPVHDYFEQVTCYENFHFAKPNPAFFTEVLAQLGWPNGTAVMVGNDLEKDILPAQKAGLATYLVTPTSIEPDNPQFPHGQGTLEGLVPWLEQLDSLMLQSDSDTPDALIAGLKATPAAFSHYASLLSPTDWSVQSQPGEWSMIEIICHLRDVALEVDIPRVQRVLQEQNPFIAAMVTDPWANERDYYHQNGPAALRDFVNCRIQLLEQLQGLDSMQWERPCRHAIFGPTRLRELVGFTSTHDRAHIQQAHQLLSLMDHPIY